MRQALRRGKAHVGVQHQNGTQQGNGVLGSGRKDFVKGNGRGIVPLQSARAQWQRLVIGPVGLVGCSKDCKYFVEQEPRHCVRPSVHPCAHTKFDAHGGLIADRCSQLLGE